MNESRMESFLDFLLFASIAGFSLIFFQIKATLRSRGYDVKYFFGWSKDYYRFRELIGIETGDSEKRRLKNILLGLYASIIGMILAPILGILLA
jgi:hypothetical protein